jgi:hypothetical protein
MVHDSDINCCEVKKHVEGVPSYDFSKMFDIFESGPWGVIDPVIDLCKALDEDVIIYMFSFSDYEQINPLNQKLMEYRTSIAHHLYALRVDVFSSQLIDIMENDVELIYLGAANYGVR